MKTENGAEPALSSSPMGMTFIDASAWKYLLQQDLLAYHKSRLSHSILVMGAGFSALSRIAFSRVFCTSNYDAVLAESYETLVRIYHQELAANAGLRQMRVAISKALAKALAAAKATARTLLELMIGIDHRTELCAPALLERNLAPSRSSDNQRGWFCVHGPRPPRRELRAAGVLLQQVHGRVHSPLAA